MEGQPVCVRSRAPAQQPRRANGLKQTATRAIRQKRLGASSERTCRPWGRAVAALTLRVVVGERGQDQDQEVVTGQLGPRVPSGTSFWLG